MLRDDEASRASMNLPAFNADGNLPPGVYRTGMPSVLLRFGTGTPQRQRIGANLNQIHELAKSTNSLDRIIIFGSFVTAKDHPNDVDVILIMKDEFRLEACPPTAAPLFDHAAAEREFSASVFWIRPGLLIADTLDQFVQRWQRTRDGGLRGIVEVPA
jgi:hypothetical protein